MEHSSSSFVTTKMSCSVKPQSSMDENDLGVDLFVHMSTKEAQEYFMELFCGSLDLAQLDTIWNNTPKEVNISMQILIAVECAVAIVEIQELRAIEEQDSLLTAQLLKAERRSGSKKRNKQNKKANNDLTKFLCSSVGAALSESQVKAFFAVKEVLDHCTYQYKPETIVEALKMSNFDPNTVVEQLLSFTSTDATVGVSSRYNNARSYADVSQEKAGIVRHAPSQKESTARSTSSAHTAGSATIICVDNSTSPPAPSPLTQYYLLLLRHRNPGIVACWDGEALLYKGTKAELSVFEHTGELVVSIDLHGQTRKPAVDMLQSSLLYFHGILQSRNYDHGLCLNFVNNGRTFTATNNKSNRSAELKSVLVIYVVGQGIHSPGAVPVLRNTLISELQAFWSMFEAGIDPENQGQIVVKIRRC